MKLEAAVVKEQGVSFAVVVVKRHVLNSPGEREKAARSFATYFPGVPIVLMAQDSRGVPTYWGRKDITRFLSNVHLTRLPWKQYTFS